MVVPLMFMFILRFYPYGITVFEYYRSIRIVTRIINTLCQIITISITRRHLYGILRGLGT